MAIHNAFKTDRIVIDPQIMGGRPVVRDTGVTVEQVLDELSRRADLREVLATFPQMSMQDLQAAVEFARQAVRLRTSPEGENMVSELGWSTSEAADTRQNLLAFADDWEDPSMDVYDASIPG